MNISISVWISRYLYACRYLCVFIDIYYIHKGQVPRWPGPDGVPEHEVQELLKFKLLYGRQYVLVRWTGLDAAGDTWEPLDNLTNCEDAIAAFEQATCSSLPRPAQPPPTATTYPAHRLHSRSGCAQRPGRCAGGQDCFTGGPTMVQQRGTVARLCQRSAF